MSNHTVAWWMITTSSIHRLIVSAPRASISGAAEQNTGAVYTCAVTNVAGDCSGLTGDGNGADLLLYDRTGEYVQPAYQFLPRWILQHTL